MSSITNAGTPRSGQDLAGSQGGGRRPQVLVVTIARRRG
jgi:hypothetical protein